jgi:hypothetical protein
MISTSRGQRPVAGPTVACVIRPSPQVIIGMSSQVSPQFAGALSPLDEALTEVRQPGRQRGGVHDLRTGPDHLAKPTVIGLDLSREPDEVAKPFPRVIHLEALAGLLG